jgi:anti-anti-sigma factor
VRPGLETPPEEAMNLKVKCQEGELTSVAVSGEVSQKRLADQQDPLQDLLGDGCYGRKVLLDLQAVEAIDSSGIGWLLTSHKQFRNQGGVLVLHSMSPFARDVLKILNMQLVFKMAENETIARRLAEGQAS